MSPEMQLCLTVLGALLILAGVLWWALPSPKDRPARRPR